MSNVLGTILTQGSIVLAATIHHHHHHHHRHHHYQHHHHCYCYQQSLVTPEFQAHLIFLFSPHFPSRSLQQFVLVLSLLVLRSSIHTSPLLPIPRSPYQLSLSLSLHPRGSGGFLLSLIFEASVSHINSSIPP